MIDEYAILFTSRDHLHELLGIELGEAVRYAIAARRAYRQQKPVWEARHAALVVTLLRIDQIIEELETISLGFPMKDVVDEAIGDAWWYLTGPNTKLPNDLWPPSLEGVYTTLLELLAGVGRWHPSYEYDPPPPGWKPPEEQAADGEQVVPGEPAAPAELPAPTEQMLPGEPEQPHEGAS